MVGLSLSLTHTHTNKQRITLTHPCMHTHTRSLALTSTTMQLSKTQAEGRKLSDDLKASGAKVAELESELAKQRQANEKLSATVEELKNKVGVLRFSC